MTNLYFAEGHAPDDALHQAQMWALNPDRRSTACLPLDVRDGLPTDGSAGHVHVDV